MHITNSASAGLFDFLFPKKEPLPIRCSMRGTISTINKQTKKDFNALKNNIKLNFDATDLKKCKQLAYSYCRNNILKRNDVPNKLKLEFLNEKDPLQNQNFIVTEDCVLFADFIPKSEQKK